MVSEDLDQAKKVLAEARLMVAQVEELKKKFEQVSAKATRLEDEVEQLKYKGEKAKEARVTKFKDLVSYQMAIGYAVVEFLAKEKTKIRRLLKRPIILKICLTWRPLI